MVRQGTWLGGVGKVGAYLLIALAVASMILSPWLLSAGLILGCGLFVAFEFALVRYPERRLRRDEAAGVPGASRVLTMKRELNAMLATSQFGITLTSLGLTLALEPAIYHLLARNPRLTGFSTGLAICLGAFFHVTFGELTPKGLALVVPRRVLYATAPAMHAFRYLAIPFIKTCNTLANLLVKSLTGRSPDAAQEDERMKIGEALLEAHTSGQIETDQLSVMRNVLSFAQRSAREVMTPAREVVALDVQEDWDSSVVLAQEHGYSRYPVVDGDLNAVLGYVRRADVLGAELEGRRDLRSLIFPIERRPETVRLQRLNLFQGAPMIALYDEYDTFVGLLTAEDVVEQIVGEIYDEGDEPEDADIVPLQQGGFRMDGSVLLEDAAEVLHLPGITVHQDIDTIGGLITKLLSRQPKAGDQVTLGPFRAYVEAVHGFRIEKLRIEVAAPPLAEAAVTGHTGV